MKIYYILFYSFILFGLSVNISCSEKSSKKSLTETTQKDEQGRTILASESSSKPLSLGVTLTESTWFFPETKYFIISREKLRNVLVKETSHIRSVYNLRIRYGEYPKITFSATVSGSGATYHDILCGMSFNYKSKVSIIFEDCSSSAVVFKETRIIIPYSEISYYNLS